MTAFAVAPVPSGSLRLRWDQFDRLQGAARVYGCSPTMLARILVNRGAKAIVDEHLRHRRLFGRWEE
jgi:hypothetical protein